MDWFIYISVFSTLFSVVSFFIGLIQTSSQKKKVFISFGALLLCIGLAFGITYMLTPKNDKTPKPTPPSPSSSSSSPESPSPVSPSPVLPSPVSPSPVLPSPVLPSPVSPSPVSPIPITPPQVTPSSNDPTINHDAGYTSISDQVSAEFIDFIIEDDYLCAVVKNTGTTYWQGYYPTPNYDVKYISLKVFLNGETETSIGTEFGNIPFVYPNETIKIGINAAYFYTKDDKLRVCIIEQWGQDPLYTFGNSNIVTEKTVQLGDFHK